MSIRNLTRTTFIAGCLLAMGVLTSPAPAHADAHTHDMYLMCTGLASNPTVAGVSSVVSSWILQQGSSDYSTSLGAQTLIDAVTYTCPEYQGIVREWANQYHNKGGTNA